MRNKDRLVRPPPGQLTGCEAILIKTGMVRGRPQRIHTNRGTFRRTVRRRAGGGFFVILPIHNGFGPLTPVALGDDLRWRPLVEVGP